MVQIHYIIRQQAKNAEKKQARDLTVFASDPRERRNPQRAAHLKEALAEERLIGVLLKTRTIATWFWKRSSRRTL